MFAGRPLGVDLAELPADHVADQFGLGQLGGGDIGGDGAAFPQHRDLVGDGEHFLQPVRDESQRPALVAQLDHDVEQPLDLAGAERCRRFVEDDEVGFQRQRLGDLDQLALRGGERAHVAVERQLRALAEAGEYVLGFPSHRAEPGQAGPAELGEKNVLDHRQIGSETGFLHDQRDAGIDGIAGAADRERLAPVGDVASIRADLAADDARQRRLAGAVGTEQSVDLAALSVIEASRAHGCGRTISRRRLP
ncbi:hypothetical protein AJ88_39925 [Mesorhizobium amorphae CCBAU 01583]|nr:hypothetical protein AJ88_39925 [Mesorhizobium amorphae CCBAU 01583]